MTGVDTASQLARNIRAERTRLGLTQAQLAEALGVGEGVVQAIEVGRRTIAFVEMPGLCRALGVTLASLCVRFSAEDLQAMRI